MEIRDTALSEVKILIPRRFGDARGLAFVQDPERLAGTGSARIRATVARRTLPGKVGAQ